MEGARAPPCGLRSHVGVSERCGTEEWFNACGGGIPAEERPTCNVGGSLGVQPIAGARESCPNCGCGCGSACAYSYAARTGCQFPRLADGRDGGGGDSLGRHSRGCRREFSGPVFGEVVGGDGGVGGGGWNRGTASAGAGRYCHHQAWGFWMPFEARLRGGGGGLDQGLGIRVKSESLDRRVDLCMIAAVFAQGPTLPSGSETVLRYS